MNARPPLPLTRRLSRRFGLSARLLGLTILFVMLAEVLIYVPSVANFRAHWLNDRLAAAQIAALVLDAAPEEQLLGGPRGAAPRGRRRPGDRGARRRAAPPAVGRRDAARGRRRPSTCARRPGRSSSATPSTRSCAPAERADPGRRRRHGGADFVEIILDQRPLRDAMLEFSRNILILSLIISGITASLVYFALQWVIVRPVRRLSGNIAAFAGDPEDASRVIRPTDRADEIGLAEQAARPDGGDAGRRAAPEAPPRRARPRGQQDQPRAAQHADDRAAPDRPARAASNDEAVQRVAPRLVAHARPGDRVLPGDARLRPRRRAAAAAPPDPAARRSSTELADLTGLAPGAAISSEARFREELTIDADPDQLSRILVNLVRNAVQALSQAGATEGREPLHPVVAAERDGGAVAITRRATTARASRAGARDLFSAFQGSARSGGTGLGLAITAELVRLHGGTIALDDTEPGACFRSTIPDRAEAERG